MLILTVNGKAKGNLSQSEKEFAHNYIKPPQIPFTISSINEKLNFHFSVKIKKDIKIYIKSEMEYSYKKGGSTTYIGKLDLIKYQ